MAKVQELEAGIPPGSIPGADDQNDICSTTSSGLNGHPDTFSNIASDSTRATLHFDSSYNRQDADIRLVLPHSRLMIVTDLPLLYPT